MVRVSAGAIALLLGLTVALLGSTAAQADDAGSTTYSPTFRLSGGSTISCTVTISHDQQIPDVLDNIMNYSGQNTCSSGVSQQAQAEYWGWDGAVVYFPQFGAGSQCSTGGSGTSCSSTGRYSNPVTNHPGAHRAVIYEWYLNAPAGQSWLPTGASFETYCDGWGGVILGCNLPHDFIIPLRA